MLLSFRLQGTREKDIPKLDQEYEYWRASKGLMFEQRHQPLLPTHLFAKRLVRNLLIGIGVIGISLLCGMFGYHHFENMNWVESFENAAMILSGMGPVDALETECGKIFAGIYALFSGIVFLIVMAIILAPVIHRFFHGFLVEDKK